MKPSSCVALSFFMCALPTFAYSFDLPSLDSAPQYRSSMDQTLDYMLDMNDQMTVDGLYGFSASRTFEVARNKDNAHYAFFQAGWFRGTDTVDSANSPYRFHFAQEVVPFTFGYRYEMALSERWLAYIGGTVGYVHSRDEKKQTSVPLDYYWKYSITSSSVSIGAMAGIRYKVTPRLEFFAGYTATAYPSLRRQVCAPEIPGKHTAISGTVSLGLTMKF